MFTMYPLIIVYVFLHFTNTMLLLTKIERIYIFNVVVNTHKQHKCCFKLYDKKNDFLDVYTKKNS